MRRESGSRALLVEDKHVLDSQKKVDRKPVLRLGWKSRIFSREDGKHEEDWHFGR